MSRERLVWSVVLLVAAAVVLPVLVCPLVTLAVVGTACFAVIKIILYYTRGW